MKRYLLFTLLVGTGAFAQSDTVVRWRGIEGVITAPAVDNPVGQIHSGAGPWTAKSGSARINLTTGEGSFEVEGLVMNGGNASGTPGAVTSVVGTLVCNVGGQTAGTTESDTDTPATALTSTGDAELTFKLNVPAACNKPLFLIRVASGKWIATGISPTTSSKPQY